MENKTLLKNVISTNQAHLKKLANLGVNTVEDLLTYFPRTYNDQSEFTKIHEIRTDQVNVIKGTLSALGEIRTKFGKRLIKARLTDDTGSVEIVWFRQTYLKRILYNGMPIILAGKAKFELGKMALINPEYETIQQKQIHTARIVPVYHETAGLTSKWLREKIYPLLKESKKLFNEYLPQEIIDQHQLIPYADAIIETHFPTNEKNLKRAKDRLAFDELFLLQIQALQRKWQWQQSAKQNSKRIIPNPKLSSFITSLPFELTNAQSQALKEILKDLSQEHPMSRLLQGDVGSGKTIVAAIAILNTIKNGYQTALMAPTEILAEQHFNSLKKIFNQQEFNIQFLTGSLKTKEKKQIYQGIEDGTVDLIIGTHALVQEKVQFKNLGLAIIDEQHRFGVEQRSILKSHNDPHLLSLSATPIPRTLAMTIYGDQDLSIIDEMPKGRLPIITRIVPENKRNDAYLWIKDRINTGRQAFIICPLIDESDNSELKSVITEYQYLQEHIFPEYKLNFLHGKMKAKEKEQIMAEFKANKSQILVSTSVIEVGIDIPNSTIMIIEGAERFGLSQLHQFRGRVGRGTYQSYCFLFMQNETFTAKQRLNALVKHTSGFKLAEIDMELRGHGDIYGIKQSGIPDLKMASLSDSITVNKARQSAELIIKQDPELKSFPLLKEKINQLDKIYLKD